MLYSDTEKSYPEKTVEARSFAGVYASPSAAKVIVIAPTLPPADRKKFEQAVASALASTNDDVDQIIAAIGAVQKNICPNNVCPEPIRVPDLTRKQRAVLTLIAQGKSNKEASKALRMSPETVKSHLSDIYRRLAVSNRAEAVNRAHQINII